MGWLGQGFFFTRFLVQWWASERARGIVVPVLFWWFSLLGGLCGGVYAFYRGNLIFLASPVVNLFIFPRNLIIHKTGRGLPRSTLLPVGLGLLTLAAIAVIAKIRPEEPPFWLILGICGQICWISRFPIQWWISERRGAASLPPLFFWVSAVGSLFLLAYALHTGDPVWIVGMALSPALYVRSLVLVYRKPPGQDVSPPPSATQEDPAPALERELGSASGS